MVKIELVNANEVQEFLKTCSQNISIASQVALQESGMLLQEEIKASIEGMRAEPRSVDTGAFLSSISTQPEGESAVSVSSDVPQAIFMEFGTIYIPERRHFRNSVDRLQQTIINKFDETIKRKID